MSCHNLSYPCNAMQWQKRKQEQEKGHKQKVNQSVATNIREWKWANWMLEKKDSKWYLCECWCVTYTSPQSFYTKFLLPYFPPFLLSVNLITLLYFFSFSSPILFSIILLSIFPISLFFGDLQLSSPLLSSTHFLNKITFTTLSHYTFKTYHTLTHLCWRGPCIGRLNRYRSRPKTVREVNHECAFWYSARTS